MQKDQNDTSAMAPVRVGIMGETEDKCPGSKCPRACGDSLESVVPTLAPQNNIPRARGDVMVFQKAIITL